MRELVAVRGDADVLEQLARALLDRAPPRRACAGRAGSRRPRRRACARGARSSRSRARRGWRRGGCSGTCARCRRRAMRSGVALRSSRALEADAALVLAVDAGEHVEERGLARAVGADQPVDLAAVDGEASPRRARSSPPKRLVTRSTSRMRAAAGSGRRRAHLSGVALGAASSRLRTAEGTGPRAGTASSPPARARRAACGSLRGR